MAYLDETRAFHENLRLFFYPKIFEEQAADTINWNQFTPELHQNNEELKTTKVLLPLLLAIGFIIFISIPLTRRL